ncbi:MAG: intraflagellar transport protein [Monoraphidium minutum]|nr:MAG: intraflagellar transport protein [Monoraphidium minutum]
MFAYLSKKIAIPNGLRLRCVAWDKEQGWIACGGENGMLKVLRLEGDAGRSGAAAPAPPAGGAAPPGAAGGALSLNQNLEGHSGAVTGVAWNGTYQKLASSDEGGLIIVWALHDGVWCEEMVNNRNKSFVRDFKWTPSGEKICIAYDDGAVIVGSVDGNRLWGKDLGMGLSLVEWSADARLILFGTSGGECHAYDASGNAVSKVPLYCNGGYGGASRLVAAEWYDGSGGAPAAGAPVLALALDNGRLQLMRHEADDGGVCVDTGMRVRSAKWSPDGSVLAVTGLQAAGAGPGARESWLVQFYSSSGEHLNTLRVPAPPGGAAGAAAPGGLSGAAWEGGGLRVALAVEAAVLFASVRREHLWGYFSGTLAYAFVRADRPQEHCVMFWDARSNSRVPPRYAKFVRRLVGLRTCGDFAVLATSGDAPGEHVLLLCNAIGSPVDSRYIDHEPKHLCITDTHVIAASDEVVFTWQFRSSFSRLSPAEAAAAAANVGAAAVGGAGARDRVMHIDAPSTHVAPDAFKPAGGGGASADPVAAVAASNTCLVVARSSGVVYRYSLPGLTLEGQHLLRCRPHRLALNCDSTRLGVVDFGGTFSILDMRAAARGPGDAPAAGGDARGAAAGGGAAAAARGAKVAAATAAAGLAAGGRLPITGEHLALERRDVWGVLWARDNPDLVALSEKGRLYVLRGGAPEEPVASIGYIAAFTDLEVRTVYLDDVMAAPEAPDLSCIADYETRSLRDTRALLASGASAASSASFVSDNPHPRLWRLLAEHALEARDWGGAEAAFVRCCDLTGIQLARSLAAQQDPLKQTAEVCLYFKRFEEAEDAYRRIDRLDLAVALRSRLGDWFRVEKLLREGGGSDAELREAAGRVGRYYSDRHKWAKAVPHFTQARDSAMLAECLYRLEDYPGLAALAAALPEADPLLLVVGGRLQSVGLAAEAVGAFLRAGDARRAVECCVALHQWDRAMDLAARHDYPEAEALLQRYAGHLLEGHRDIEAAELYRKAQRHADAARLLSDKAAALAAARAPPLRLKKLHVLAALEVEAFRELALGAAAPGGGGGGGGGRGARSPGGAKGGGGGGGGGAAATLEGLMSVEAAAAGSRAFDGAWRGAEAYHFWLLAHRQLYGGQVEAALRTALALRSYDDVLDPSEVWSFLALAAFYARFYGTCSKAFVKLESLPAIPEARRAAFAEVALAVFAANVPADPAGLREAAAAAARGGGGGRHGAMLDDLEAVDRDQVCVASGKALPEAGWQRCRRCRHAMITAELGGRRTCPLCHAALPAGGGQQAGVSASPSAAQLHKQPSARGGGGPPGRERSAAALRA